MYVCTEDDLVVPLILMHVVYVFGLMMITSVLPKGGIDEALDKTKDMKKEETRTTYEKQCYAKDADEEENIIFEDFAKLRMSMSELDN